MAHFYFARCSWTLLTKTQEHNLLYFLFPLHCIPFWYLQLLRTIWLHGSDQILHLLGKPVNLIWKFTLFFLCYLEVPNAFTFCGCFYMHRTYSIHLAHTKLLVLQAQRPLEIKHGRAWEYTKLLFPIIQTQIFDSVIY